MLSVDEARRKVLEAMTPLPVEELPIAEARGLVLSETVHAPHPLPRWDNSAMDGYALRGDEGATASAESPLVLEIVGEVRAGDPGDIEVGSGTAVRIMTGAPLPPG